MNRRISFRMDKVNSEIQKELSQIINSELQNPKIDDAIISLTTVHTAPDFSSAKIYISALNSSLDKEEILAELAEASGFLKKRLAENLKLKRTPALRFLYDDSIEQGDKIMRLIDSLNNKG